VTEEEAYSILQGLASCYPRADWGVDTIRAWARLIVDLEYQPTQIAVISWASTERWPPQSAAEIRERVLQASGKAGPSAAAAWDEVVHQIQAVGFWGEPSWSDDMIGRAAMALRGGWRELCATLTVEELVAERAHFMRIYDSFAADARRSAQEVPALTPGLGVLALDRQEGAR